jgi:hypothetical protein
MPTKQPNLRSIRAERESESIREATVADFADVARRALKLWKVDTSDPAQLKLATRCLELVMPGAIVEALMPSLEMFVAEAVNRVVKEATVKPKPKPKRTK